MPFATETFAGTGGTELSAYAAAWSKQTSFAQNAVVGIDGPYFNVAAAAYGCYQHSASPAGADYSVAADIKRIGGTANPQMGVCGRMQAGAGTFYSSLHIHSLNSTRLYVWVAGTPTQIGSSYANTLTTGVAQTHELRMTGSTIELYIDGVLRISATDTTITTAGKAGIIGHSMRDSGVADTGSIDNWSATDAAATSDLSGNVTLDDVAPAGTLADGGASGLSGGVTLDAVAPAGTLGVAPGAYSIPALTNWSGSVQAAVTVPWVTFQRLADGVQVLVLADQVTNGSGDLSGTNAALAAGTTYMVCGWNADGSARFARPVTAT